MDKEAALQRILLSELPHVGERTLRRLFLLAAEHQLAPVELLRLPAPALVSELKLPRNTVRFLQMHGPEYRRRCEWLAEHLAGHGGLVATFLDRDFPKRWSDHLVRAPALVFAAGDPAALRQRSTCAVLHSREPTAQTLSATSTVLRALADQGLALVGSVHKAPYRLGVTLARSLGCPRVLVLDRGLFQVLGPNLDRDPLGGPLRQEAREWEWVLSPFRLFDHAVARSGARRDELVAALADVIVALNARPGGGIERVCLQALERGQCVLSWQGESRTLVGAGALPVSEPDLKSLPRFLAASV